jgi:hypothetical protein
MTQTGILSLTCSFLFSVAAFGQTCPKVAYTTPTATMKNLVTSVNCLVGTAADKNKTSHVEVSKTGLLVDSFQVVGPQHTRIYRKVVLALLSVSAGNEIKTALVTPDGPEASVAGTAGAECKVKINPDSTVEGHCNLTGGTLYVVYHN